MVFCIKVVKQHLIIKRVFQNHKVSLNICKNIPVYVLLFLLAFTLRTSNIICNEFSTFAIKTTVPSIAKTRSGQDSSMGVFHVF